MKAADIDQTQCWEGKHPTGPLLRRRQWAQDVARILLLLMTLAVLLVGTGTLLGWFEFRYTLSTYILLGAGLAAWGAAHTRAWRLAAWIMVLMCFGLGVYSSYRSGFDTIFVLFYGLAVLLAGMLISPGARLVVAGASIAAYVLFGQMHAPGPFMDWLGWVITFMFGLAGVAALQMYYSARVEAALDEQVRLNLALCDEMEERKRALEALRLSEEKFSTAFIASPDSININRLTDGRYVDINQGFTRLMGYTREEVIGRSSLELNIWVNPADRARLTQELRAKGEVENFEAPFRRKNGQIGIGLMSARVMQVGGELCILSITRDITERIEAQEALRLAHERLEESYQATLEGWARALELREHETATHSRRVVELTVKIAERLGLDEETLGHIRRGALLHDIGKLGVPDAILLKPGPLTAEEWVLMRLHPEYGRDLLRDIPYLQPAVEIPYGHHEHWDGSGYPQGLRGEAIPLAARIFTVVDVYDALTSDRPYRLAWNSAAARHYLAEHSGQLFDPHIVQVFFQIRDEAD